MGFDCADCGIFLMPGQIEPFGLNQFYSLRYGAVPVVRATGGLADTVTDTTPGTLAAGTATGFCFKKNSVLGLSEALRRACEAYARGDLWRQIVATGTGQNCSWTRSATKRGHSTFPDNGGVCRVNAMSIQPNLSVK